MEGTTAGTTWEGGDTEVAAGKGYACVGGAGMWGIDEPAGKTVRVCHGTASEKLCSSPTLPTAGVVLTRQRRRWTA